MKFFRLLSITFLLLFMSSLKGFSQNYKNMRIVVFSSTTNTPTLLIEGNMYLTRAGNTITVNVKKTKGYGDLKHSFEISSNVFYIQEELEDNSYIYQFKYFPKEIKSTSKYY